MAIDLLDPARRDVARIERAAADALGPDEEVVRDGWRLRANAGVARRANSALPVPSGATTSLPDVEAFYRRRGLVPRVQLSVAAPPGLDARLERRGWLREVGAVVMLGPTVAAARASSDAERSIDVGTRPSEAWLALQEAVTPGRRAWARRRADVLADDGRRAWHALLHDAAGRPVASALAVLDRPADLVGLFAFVTATDVRRRGHARRLLEALLAYGRRSGVTRAYLQVHPANGSAISLYRSVGFREHHRYHYRRAP